MRYRCIEGLVLEKADDNGFTIDNEYIVIDEGEIWFTPEDEDYRLLGGEIRLENKLGHWIQIPEDTLKECFSPGTKYDANICNECLCKKCKYSVEIRPDLTEEECSELMEGDECFNCDKCYYYGMDDESLSEDKVMLSIDKKCNKFEKSNYYKELEAKKRRNDFQIIETK